MKILATILALIAAPLLASADEMPTTLSSHLEDLRALCADFENGTLAVSDDAISRPDLNGDGTPDWVLDEGRLSCSSMASMSCGTGGCGLTLVVDNVLTDRLSKGWKLVSFDPLTVLLIQVHGANCGGTNLNRCVEALVWDAELKRFLTIAPPPPQ
ncbi:hypothetical protein [Meridianimarinicoccus aquatilis]|uniref:Uncharacterized protein n=1 Tax=Meridianimarinicoccus aquatilis TaxID=2552766 RepID=A0A4R6B5T5_9RHOB|nr:hypothetical protein [Fluviibacterium aquatile]TDL91461.1 hypothetical protein E2L05_00715 [Fluviibacterium aquatile]